MDINIGLDTSHSKLRGFLVKEKIGCGSYSSVYRAYDRHKNRDVAIKCIDQTAVSKNGADSIIREIKILKMMEHPHIVNMIDFCWDDRYVYILLEYCNGGDLSKYIKQHRSIPEIICKKFMLQLVDGLGYLRSKGIYHYDLKPQNILLHKDPNLILKIGDFGLSLFASTLLGGDKVGVGPRGSPSYMAPEMLICKDYDPAMIDLWSLGVILYECLHGQLPYPQKTIKDIVKALVAKRPIKIDEKLSPDCKSILELLLCHDPKSRVTFEDMLKHRFMNIKCIPVNQDTYSKALQTVRQAVRLDFDQEYHRAFNKYCESLRYLVPITTKSAQDLQSTHDNVPQAESARGLTEQDDGKSNITVANVSERCRIPTHLTSEQVLLLKGMAKSTPKMFDGLDFGYAAQMYLYEGNFPEALNKYVLALSSLVPILRNEPSGKRKELLTIQVKEWLEQAESIKILLEANTEIRKLIDANYTPKGALTKNTEEFCRIH